MPTHLDIARGYLGTREAAGPENNPLILQMYASVGADWVEHDSVAWCAAFVGHCLERAGIRSTRKLTARSYLSFGEAVDLKDAREGDIVVFKRGNSSWQGHVAFYIADAGGRISVLGGNQGNAVTIAKYPKAALLGVRRVTTLTRTAPAPSIMTVQRKLRDLGYHEVGTIDGMIGPRTRAAVLAFRSDNGLPLTPDIDVALTEAMEEAEPRPVSEVRAHGQPQTSRIVSAANAQVAAGTVGGVVSTAAAIGPVLEQAEEARGLTERAAALFNLNTTMAEWMPWIMIAVCAAVVVFAWRTRAARIADYRMGKTP
jgi:uncharacterized protein (TIGR02594 family)